MQKIKNITMLYVVYVLSNILSNFIKRIKYYVILYNKYQNITYECI